MIEQREIDDLTASMRAAAEDPDFIPILVEEYLKQYPSQLPAAPCPLPHIDTSKEYRAERIRDFFWVQFWWAFALSYIMLLSIAMVSYSSWKGSEPMIEWGAALFYAVACLVGSVIWAKFAIWWKQSNYDL